MNRKGPLGIRYFYVGTERILDYTYWNSDGCGVVILAREGRVADWGAYIGALPLSRHTEEQAIRHVAANGIKLSKEQAIRWFPHLPSEAYRP